MHNSSFSLALIMRFGATAVLLAATFGCSADTSDTTADTSAQTDTGGSGCEAGTEGCACIPGDVPCGSAGLVCEAGLCVDPEDDCPPGSLGCACYGNATCNSAADGTGLVCQGTTCTYPQQTGDCTVGEVGCGCYPNATCNASGTEVPIVCQGQICTALPGEHDCPSGQLGCPCYGNGSCNIGGDGTAMACQGNVCVVPEAGPDLCPTGDLTCSCYPNKTCNLAASGKRMECTVEGICVAPKVDPEECPEGDVGCSCYGNSTCNKGAQGETLHCVEGLCEVKPVTPEGCATGSLGCTCYGNSTCDVLQSGVSLVCENNVCLVADGACEEGSLGCTCFDNGTCDAGLTCQDTACVAAPTPKEGCNTGELACDCYGNATCNGGLACVGGVCAVAEQTCPPGSVGCACYGNGTCNEGAAGVTVVCEGNLCQAKPDVVQPGECPTGTLGCACYGNGTCNLDTTGKAMACVDTTCEIATTPVCTPGSLYCACTLGGECDSGLVCGATNKCIVPTCPVGQIGCACKANGSCNDSSQFCDTDSTCQSPWCSRGELGCGCKQDGSCNPSFGCQLGVCVVSGQLGPVPPEDPQCYTPCSNGMVDATGSWLACDNDGLLPGCLSGQACVNGSCVAVLPPPTDDEGVPVPDAPPIPVVTVPDGGQCGDDNECPSFQTCIDGNCFSNCETDGECNPGHACRFKVCRKNCTTGGTECEDGYMCESRDGVTGFCMIEPAEVAVEPKPDLSNFGFRLSEVSLSFDALNTIYGFRVLNDSPAPITVTVRKQQHAYYTTEGLKIVDTNPLSWLHLGQEGQAAKVAEVTVTVPAASGGEPGSVIIDVAEADETEQQEWQGVLAVEGKVGTESLGIERVRLSYVGRPEGQWVGEMHFFANFRDTGLSAWVNGPDGNYGTMDDHYWMPEHQEVGNSKIQQIQNAFVKRWIAMKQGDISLDEFAAMLNQTLDGSWNYANIKTRCPNENSPNVNQGCYLYDDPNIDTDSGIVTYSAALDADPIPSGVSSLPLTLNLSSDPATPQVWSGRIDSAGTLHYPGNPSISLSFTTSPLDCNNQDTSKACLAYVQGLIGTIVMGGRYESPTGQCPDGAGKFSLFTQPWLLDDFTPDYVNGASATQHCVFQDLPAGPADVDVNKSINSAMPVPNGQALTRTLRLVDGALINQREMVILFEEQFPNLLSPDPNDKLSSYGVITLRRSSQQVDFADFIGNDQKQYALNAAQEPQGKLGVACTTDVLEDIAAGIPEISPEDAQSILDGSFVDDVQLLKQVALATVGGTAALAGAAEPFCENGECDPPSENGWTAHYLCEDTGLFNGGPDPDNPIPCPHGSNVVFFATRGNLGPQGARLEKLNCQANSLATKVQFKDHAPATDFTYSERYCTTADDNSLLNSGLGTGCQGGAESSPELGNFISLKPASDEEKGNCAAELQKWKTTLPAGVDEVNFNVVSRCYDASPNSFEMSETWCDADRYDLLHGRMFYDVPKTLPTVDGLSEAIRDAFRYKTRFVNREGSTLGFTPEVCKFGAEQGEYCYAPADIDQIRERVDCAVHLYTTYFQELAPQGDQTRAIVRGYLQNVFGRRIQNDLGQTQHSFERLYADLLMTHADDAYTNSFAGRFDLAGEATESFEGAKFEPGGIDLTGGAGYEMFNLYKSVQYYRLILDRFYHLAPSLWRTLENPELTPLTFVTADTVVRYMDRVVRASSQKARAWSEIAERYHAFYQPELARRVVERAYGAAYLESILLTSTMNTIIEAFQADAQFSASVAQLRLLLENTQLKYTQALLRMRDLRADLNAELTYFGFAPEYIPFPAMAEPTTLNADNAVSLLVDKAWERALVAAEKEDLAISKNKAFETDQAEFEKELLALRTNYKQQLQELCGSFEGDDGTIYPAIGLYAEHSAATLETQKALGDICGNLDSGSIWAKKQELAAAEVQLKRVETSQANLISRVDIERQRVSEQCGEIMDLTNFKMNVNGQIVSLEVANDDLKFAAEEARKAADQVGKIAQIALSGSLLTKASATAAAAAYKVAAASGEVVVAALHQKSSQNKLEIGDLENAQMGWEGETQCDLAVVDSNAKTREIVLEMKQVELNAIDAARDATMKQAEVASLYRDVEDRLHDLSEIEQSIINVAIAKNDPNQRIYKNDAIVTADRTFQRALRAAYQATKVYEYYTSSSYAYLGDLFLVRMVQYGDNTLEQYLEELEDSFDAFEELYGKPDLRVEVLSLKDDILDIPTTVGDQSCGTPAAPSNICTVIDRAQMFQQRLANPELLDDKGYVVLPFSTSVNELSPLTRNHKVYYVEAEVVGTGLGDASGRVYLRQAGVGTVSRLEGGKNFYAFPERTGVLDTWFNGDKPYDQDIYKSWRFRERPVANSQWELILNLVDEPVNTDIDLRGVQDIKLYVYYTDFTVL